MPDSTNVRSLSDLEPGAMRRRGCLVITIIAALLAVIGGATGSALLSLADEANTIRVVMTPERVQAAVGEPFTLTLAVENVAMEAVTLDNVGLEAKFDRILRLDAMDPPYTAEGTRDFPLLGTWTTYTLDRTLFGGESLTITLTLTALQPGKVAGDVSVWVRDSMFGVPIARARHATLELDIR